jgi:cytochrome c553
MSILNKTRGIGVGLAAILASFDVFAVTATPGSVSVVSRNYQTVKISNVNGSVLLKNSKPSVVTVSKVSTNVYSIYGTTTGTAVLEFKDRKSTAKVYVTVTAQPTAQTTAETAPPAGRLLASNCFQCHGTNGKGPGFDTLAGKSASEIYRDLKEFQSGKEGNGIMAKHAMGYTDAQLLSLSSWLSTQR